MTNPGDFDCNFRHALPTDRDQLHRLIERCWLEVYSPHLPRASNERFLADDPIGTHLDVFLSFSEVAVIGDEIVGVVAVADGGVFSLFVGKFFRGNRIGSCLLHNAVLAGGRWLEVPVFNLHAMAFYEASGWRKAGESFEDIGGTRAATIVMQVGAFRNWRDVRFGADCRPSAAGLSKMKADTQQSDALVWSRPEAGKGDTNGVKASA